MRELKFSDKEKGVQFFLTESGEWEYAHPLEKIGELYITSSISITTNYALTLMENNKIPPFDAVRNPFISIERFACKQALKGWEEEMDKLKNTVLPDKMMDILSATKKEQVRILRNITLTTEQLIAFIVKAGDYGYTFSNYRSYFSQTGLDTTQMPRMAYKEEDGSITKIGNTTLSDGQLLNAINHRTVRIAKFLDNGSSWHCFYLNYRSISGAEAYKGGAHIHFISHTYSLTRDQVLSQLRSKVCPLPGFHVGYDSGNGDD